MQLDAAAVPGDARGDQLIAAARNVGFGSLCTSCFEKKTDELSDDCADAYNERI